MYITLPDCIPIFCMYISRAIQIDLTDQVISPAKSVVWKDAYAARAGRVNILPYAPSSGHHGPKI